MIHLWYFVLCSSRPKITAPERTLKLYQVRHIDVEHLLGVLLVTDHLLVLELHLHEVIKKDQHEILWYLPA